MSGKTISEKIFCLHSGKDVKAGDIVVANLDYMMGHDGSFPLAIEVMREMGREEPFDSKKVGAVIDHYTPSPNEKVSSLHKMMREYSLKYGCNLFDIGEGICHQIIPESGNILPGNLVIGGDSHTCTYGALNAFSTGVGSTELAVAIVTGKLWFKVPETIRINIVGSIPSFVYSKDIIMSIIGQFKSDGANYKAVEFHGEAIEQLSMEARFTISNMAVEMGAKAGLMIADSKTKEWLADKTKKNLVPISPDNDAKYENMVEFDISKLEPQISTPHNVENSVSVNVAEGIKIQQANIGSCTNGRIEDLEIAASILKGKRVNPNVRLIITPASRNIYIESLKRGLLEIFVESGAIIVPPSCGWCCGTCNGIPSNGENVIATSNRNFKGRMGNNTANIYLASPATVAVSVLAGEITDPRKWEGV
ncbi:MAG: 3-isopropylmalate dehydratase large subunit [Sedimentibacter sp.]